MVVDAGKDAVIRQRIVLNRLLDGFTGKLTTRKWATLAECSHDTALRDIQSLIDQGLSNPEIAARLTVATSTVKTHINNIYGKLSVKTRVQAINRAHELGLL